MNPAQTQPPHRAGSEPDGHDAHDAHDHETDGHDHPADEHPARAAIGRDGDQDHDVHSHEDHFHQSHDHEAPRLRRRLPRLTVEYLFVATSGLFTGLGLLGGWLGWSPTITLPLFLAAIVAGGLEIVPRGLKGVFLDKTLDINFLITLAVAGAMILGEWGEGATVVFLFSLGEALESATLARTRRAIQGLMAMAPETAQVKTTAGTEQTSRVEDIPVGATVIVRPGDRIPLDGEVLLGNSAVNQAPITGESVPVDKSYGDAVYGGTINTTGYLELRTTKPFAQNTIARIIHLVESAQSEKAPSQRLVERFARVYTPVVVLLAIAVALLPPLILNEPIAPWFNRALVLLLIACPCALVLATPVAVVAAIGNASRHGALVKGGVYLERAGSLRAVAFDKTGTLTRGVPEIQTVIPLGSLPELELLRLAAAAESRSEHPLARAIVRAFRLHDAGPLPSVDHFQALTGSGIHASVAGTSVMIGRPTWLRAAGLVLGPAEATLSHLASQGQTAIVVASSNDERPDQPLAIIGIADQLRPTAAHTIQALRRSGLARIVMLSGDHQTTAEAIAGQAGILPQDVYGDLLPEGKVEAIQQLIRAHGHVAMVGDGINDAPALAAATVGIAIGAGASDTTLETADVALVADDLTRIPWVLDLARQTSRTIKLNITIALTTKAAVALLAAFGLANLWLAIATDVGATVLVILNGMRLLGGVSTDAPKDATAVRARYGLGKEDPHAGHAH